MRLHGTTDYVLYATGAVLTLVYMSIRFWVIPLMRKGRAASRSRAAEWAATPDCDGKP